MIESKETNTMVHLNSTCEQYLNGDKTVLSAIVDILQDHKITLPDEGESKPFSGFIDLTHPNERFRIEYHLVCKDGEYSIAKETHKVA
jgi:hypothetical protein